MNKTKAERKHEFIREFLLTFALVYSTIIGFFLIPYVVMINLFPMWIVYGYIILWFVYLIMFIYRHREFIKWELEIK